MSCSLSREAPPTFRSNLLFMRGSQSEESLFKGEELNWNEIKGCTEVHFKSKGIILIEESCKANLLESKKNI